MLQTHCSICNESNFRPISNMYSAPDDPNRFQYIGDKHIVICETCGNIKGFPNETFAESESHRYGEAYYDEAVGFVTGHENIRVHVELQQLHYDRLRSILYEVTTPDRHRRWLDVGSAGSPTAFDDFEFTTIEPDPRVVRVGRSLFRAERIFAATLENFTPERLFDGVVFNHSLYCVPDPDQAVAAARRLLNNDGFLVVAVDSYFMVEDGETEADPPQRIEEIFRGATIRNGFSQINLKFLCARHGFALRGVFDGAERASTRNCRYMVFQRRDAVVDAPSLASVRAYHHGRLAALMDGLGTALESNRALVDRPDVAIIGTSNLIMDLWADRPPRHAVRHIDMRLPDVEREFRLGGVAFQSVAETARAITTGSIRNVVLASYRLKDQAAALAARLPLDGVRVFAPPCVSGLERLHGFFNGSWRPIKGFMLAECPVERVARPRLEGMGVNRVINLD